MPRGPMRAGASSSRSPAGSYQLTAQAEGFVSLEYGTEYQDPEFLEALRSLGTRVVLNEGDTKVVALRIIKR